MYNIDVIHQLLTNQYCPSRLKEIGLGTEIEIRESNFQKVNQQVNRQENSKIKRQKFFQFIKVCRNETIKLETF